MIMKKLLTTLAVVLAFAATNAQAILLTDLFNGASLTVGDKRFDNWTSLASSNALGDPLDISAIEVTGIDGGTQNPGLRYAMNGAMQAFDFDWLDLYFSFDVTVLDPDMRINGTSLEITDYLMGANNIGGLIDITEDVFDAGANQVVAGFPEQQAVVDILSATDDPLADAVIDSLSMITVETWIIVAGDDFGDEVDFISFEQHFSQVEVVPEPAMILLFGFGLTAIGFVRRKWS